MSPKVMKLLEHCEDNDIEIVSYGLAPNPNGFCYERGEETSDKACSKMNSMLDGLNNKEEKELRKYIFG